MSGNVAAVATTVITMISIDTRIRVALHLCDSGPVPSCAVMRSRRGVARRASADVAAKESWKERSLISVGVIASMIAAAKVTAGTALLR